MIDVLVHAGKLNGKAAEALVKQAAERKVSFVSALIAAGSDSDASVPGAQNVVSLIQTDSREIFPAKPKAWNISIERTLMPSAWPFSI